MEYYVVIKMIYMKTFWWCGEIFIILMLNRYTELHIYQPTVHTIYLLAYLCKQKHKKHNIKQHFIKSLMVVISKLRTYEYFLFVCFNIFKMAMHWILKWKKPKPFKNKKHVWRKRMLGGPFSHQIHWPFFLNPKSLLLLSQYLLKMNPDSLDAEMTC